MPVTAPGKVLLAGEYAILEGHPAVVMAVSRRVTARLAPGAVALSPFLAAARDVVAERFGAESPEAKRAARVTVDSAPLSQDGKKLGLGSSAAATVAAVAAALATEDRATIHALAHHAHARAQEARGARGSGADVAASVHGGLLRVIRAADAPEAPLVTERLSWPEKLHVVLLSTASPAHTPSLVAGVRALYDRDPRAYAAVVDPMGRVAADLAAALAAADAAACVQAIFAGAEAFQALAAKSSAPLIPPAFAEVERLARSLGGAAKPTGAGGGDLLLAAFADAAAARTFAARAPLPIIDAPLDPEGVRTSR